MQTKLNPVPLRTTADERVGGRATIQELVEAFSVQDIAAIMQNFAEDSVFFDVTGSGQKGTAYHGKPAIQLAFERQFELLGAHTYENSCIGINGQRGFAAWTLVLLPKGTAKPQKFDGIDHFELDASGKVLSKQAWLKDHGRLQRTVIFRNFGAVMEHARYGLLRR